MEISNKLGCTPPAIRHRLKNAGIQRRGLCEAQLAKNGKEWPKELDDYETMYAMYVLQRMPKSKLGEIFGISPAAVGRHLMKLGISIRGDSESKVGTRCGAQHHNWKGGVTKLTARLREYYQKNLSPVVRERDGYRCKICGTKSNLHTHHIIPFSQIVQEILSEHPDLDPVSDVNELCDIVTHEDRFLDTSNLITLCKDCHFYIAHEYDKSISNEASTEERSTTIPQGSTPQADGGGNGEAPTGSVI